MKTTHKQGKKRQTSGLLWDRDPRLSLAKQVYGSDDNWLNKVESDFVQASIAQRRWNIAWIVIWVSLAFLGVLGFAAFFWYQLQLSQLREKAARAGNLLQADDPVEGLVLAIQTIGQNRSTPIVDLGIFRNPILPEVQMSLSSAVQTARELNRFQDGIDVKPTAVALSPEGKTIASGAQDGTIRLWDVASASGEPFRFPQAVSNPDDMQQGISAIAFSPDGQQILSGRQDGSVQLWDLQGNLQGEWRHNQAVTSVAFVAGSKVISSSQDGSIYLGNLAQNINQYQVLAPQNEDTWNDPAFVAVSRDGKNIAAIRNDEILLGNSQSDKLIKLKEDKEPLGLPVDLFKSRCSIAFLNNQTLLIGQGGCSSASGTITKSNFEVQEWKIDLEEAKVFSSRPFQAGNRIIESVAGQGETIASDSSNNSILVWQKGQQFVLSGHTADVNQIAFNPSNTQQLVSASEDGTIRLWDISESFDTQDVKYQELQFKGQEVKVDGEYIRDYVTSTAFSPDGNYFAISRQNVVMLFDDRGQLAELPFEGHQDEVTAVAFSPDGKTIVSGSRDKKIRIWDLAGNSTILEGHQDEVTAVAFSPDGKTIVSGSRDKTAQIWDAATGQRKGEPLRGHADAVNSVAFSPDGKIIVSGSNDRTIRFWNLEGKPTGSNTIKNAHRTGVKSVFFKDANTIVSASTDQTIKFWHLDGSSAAESFLNRTEIDSPEDTTVAFSPKGNIFLTSIEKLFVNKYEAEAT